MSEPQPEKTTENLTPRASARRRIRLKPVLRWTAFLALAAAVIALALPALVERTVNGILTAFADHGRFAVEVRRLDLWGCDCALEARSEARKEALSEVENLSLRYSPLRLIFLRQIDAAVIRGVRVPVEFTEQGVRFPVLDILKKNDGTGSSKASGQTKSFQLRDLPVAVRRAELRGAILLKTSDGAAATLPFGAELSCPGGNWSKMEFLLALGSGKNRLVLRGTGEGESPVVAGEIEGAFDSMDLPGALRNFVPASMQAILTGKGDFLLSCDLAEGCLSSFETSGAARVDVTAAGCRLTGEPRWKMTWDGTHFRADFGGLAAGWAGKSLKLEASFLAMDCTARRGEGRMVFAAAANPAALEFAWSRTPAKAWQFRLRLDPGRNQALSEGTLEGTYGDDGRFAVRGAVKSLTWALPALTLRAESIALAGEGSRQECTFRAALDGLRMAGTGEWYTFTLPALTCSGRRQGGELAGSLHAEKGVFALSAAQLAVREIAWDQPWCWPLEKSPRGVLTAGAIAWQDKVLGEAKAETSLHQFGVTADGAGELCRLATRFHAAAEFGSDGFRLDSGFTVPAQDIRDNLNLRKLFPDQLGDLELSGKAAAEGAFAMAGGKQSGQVALHLSEVRAASAEKDWEITGLAADFALPNLPELRSAGQQRLRCKTVRYGTILIDSLLASCRMDAPTSWCLERLILKWCGGTVRAEYLQFDPKSRVIPLTVHCDRLDLVPFLVQLGAGKGAGTGRISGTLPVIYSQEQGIRVGDGFLYTTPGEDGKIAMEFSEAVRESQQDNPVFDMAQAALRDFSYSWAKIHMGTVDDLLKLSMQLNGKPEKPLYFTYADGGIVKTNVPHRFQGIMLDLNLALPLQDIFELVKRF